MPTALAHPRPGAARRGRRAVGARGRALEPRQRDTTGGRRRADRGSAGSAPAAPLAARASAVVLLLTSSAGPAGARLSARRRRGRRLVGARGRALEPRQRGTAGGRHHAGRGSAGSASAAPAQLHRAARGGVVCARQRRLFGAVVLWLQARSTDIKELGLSVRQALNLAFGPDGAVCGASARRFFAQCGWP